MFSMKTIYIGSDHAGFNTKKSIISFLEKQGIPFVDEGAYSKISCDYTFYANEVAREVLSNNSKGILICGTGIGMSIAANKIKGIRAALVHSPIEAKLSRSHNDANILVLSSRNSLSQNQKIIKVWLATKFSRAVRHKRRLEQLE